MTSTGAYAIILAAGTGTRMAAATSGVPKQFLEWRNRPLYWHSAMAFSQSCCVDGIIFVLPADVCATEFKRIEQLDFMDSLGLPWKLVSGGPTRQDSARLGLEAVPLQAAKILIHDAARPFIAPALISRVCSSISEAYPAVIPGVAITDTVKQVSVHDQELVERTPPRSLLRAIQTPQGFDAAAIRRAHNTAQARSLEVTDDASLMEYLGMSVKVVAGDAANLKITNPEDLKLLDTGPEAQAIPCSGFGYDVHKYGSGRPLKLGGVIIPGAYEVVAHSDGDVVLHALMDALLGMAGMGDIGRHFPDDNPDYDGISSAILLDEVLDMTQKSKVKICHADLTLVAQKPRIAPFAGEIARNIARLLKLPETHVNFKATTEEWLGFTGSLQGIKAYALVTGMRH